DPAPTQDAPPGPDTGIDRPALDHEAGLTAAGDGPADDPAGPGTDASAPDSAAADTPGPTDGEPPVPATPAAAFPPGSAALPELAADPPHKAPPVQVDPTGEPSAPGPRRTADWARRTGRALVALASVVAVVLLGAGWGYLRSTDGQYHQVAALDVHSDDIRDPAAQYGDENYLIVGTDSRGGDNSMLGAGTEEGAGGTRTDTIILVHVPSDRSRVVAVSFPRDLNVDRPACQAWDDEKGEYTGETYGSEYDVKLNGVFYTGGPQCLVKVVQKLSGLKINHFV